MHRRPLGPGAPAVTAVGYGGMHLSIEGRPPEEQSLRVLQAALDAGVTLIDTADVYCLDQHDIGHNERLIAQALAGWRGRPRERHRRHQGRHRPARRPLGHATPGPSSSGRPASAPCARWASSGWLSTSSTRPIPACRWPTASASWRGFATEGKLRWIGLSNVSLSPDPRGAGASRPSPRCRTG